ncbi:hypothetical protein [Zooshikella ganghwensis]|uniref:hypothetical protein n=1 Tax=Zooshikella ganghwensis TaxID=202772 RepID=UPI000415FDB6|nr:hypothetical protein [Zooshikella ganghwensis]
MASSVTREAVFTACKKLFEETGHVKQADVQAITGGSFTKLGPWIQEWKVLNARLNGLEYLDHELLAGLNEWCLQLKEKFQSEAAKQNEDLHAELTKEKEKQAQFQQDKDKQRDELANMHAKLAELRDTVSERERHIDRKRTELSQLKTERLEFKQRYEAELQTNQLLKNSIEQLQRKVEDERHTANKRLHDEMKRISDLYEANENKLYQQLDESRRAQREQEKRSGQENDKLRQEVSDLSKQKNELNSQLVRTQADLAIVQERLQEKEKSLDSLTEQHQQTLQTLQQEKERRQEMHVQLGQLKGQFSVIQERHDQLEHQLRELRHIEAELKLLRRHQQDDSTD